MPADFPFADPAAERAWRQRLGELRHDLVNPLGEILGFAEMLLEENPAPGSAAVVSGLGSIRLTARRVLADLNRALHPDSLRADPEHLTVAAPAIRQLLDELAATAQRLFADSPPGDHGSLRDDLTRIAGSAGRLCKMQAAVFAEAAALRCPVAAPVAPSEETQAPFSFAPRTAVVPTGAPLGAGAEILVVDDLEANRALLQRRLMRRGFVVTLAENGRLALDLLRTRRFDLVLLDIMMPELDGREVLRRIKADPQLAHIPVLMLSALDELDAVVRCIELGAEDYLPKPFPSALLHARVDASLANKRMSDQLRKYAGWLFGKTLFSDAVAAPASLVLKRHERTVLFADIRGFTAWSERHSPEETVTMLNRYFETAEQVWAGSSLIKTEYTGDEIMGVFPGAADAVRIAQALRGSLGELLAQFELGVGIGLHSGPVIEGLMGGADVKAYRFVGDTVNVTKRICSEARAGQLLVSNATYTEARELAVFGAEFPINAKGKTEPLLLRTVIGLVP